MTNRRVFLKGLGAAGAGLSLSSVPLGLGLPAAAQAGPRSLVCIFLYGGADSFNMYVPRDHGDQGQSHAVYSATRGAFAVPARDLLGIHDGAFGLHPGLPGLADIAARDQLAVVQNMGPLVAPTTRDDFLNTAGLPQSLFAHNAQQKLWQTARPLVSSDSGWGGSIAAASPPGSVVDPAFSISGSVPWLSSRDVGYSRLSSTVAIERLVGFDSSLRSWIPSSESLQLTMEAGLASASSSVNPFERAAADALSQSIVTTEQLQDAVENTDVGMNSVSPGSLAGRLHTVAKLIANREALGMGRQVFFVGMGGWDTHGGQVERFPVLCQELNDGITAYQAALDGLGVSESVTTFTASDFGRTLTSNGDGTDHAWGGNAFVWGGAVNSGRYGTFPSLATSNNPDDTTDERGNFAGRLVPTTSVAQYGATLSRWMGLDEAQLDAAFPELKNFAARDLGFLA